MIARKLISTLTRIHEKMAEEDRGFFALKKGEVFLELHRSKTRARSSLRESADKEISLVPLSEQKYGAVKFRFLETFRGSGQNPPIFEEAGVKPPPFMLNPEDLKGVSYPKATSNVDKVHDLDRGHTPGDPLGTEASDTDGVKKGIRVAFPHPRFTGEAMGILTEAGMPTYELGRDGLSLVFHTWKNKNEEAVREAIQLLKDRGLDPEVSNIKL